METTDNGKSSGGAKWGRLQVNEKDKLLELKKDLEEMRDLLQGQHQHFQAMVNKIKKYEPSKK